ncbi:MAG: hypothetical protein ACE5JF_11140 [Anaerolineales bacterium]
MRFERSIGIRSSVILIPAFLVLSIGLLSALALLFTLDPLGIGVVHDSFFYLSGAENLRAGNGLVWNAGGEQLRPLVHFPPGYSAVLAVLGGALTSMFAAASSVQAAALAATIVLVGALIFLGSGNRRVSVLGAAVAATSPILFERYLDIRSEPIFLVSLLGSIAALLRYLQTNDRRFLWGAGALAAASGLFRYAGLAVMGSGILTIVILQPGSMRQRIGAAIRFAAIPTAIFVMLALRNFYVSGSVTNRVLAYHPPGLATFRQGAASISEWIMPPDFDPVIRLFVIATVGAGAALVVWFRKGGTRLLTILAIYSLVYAGSLIFSLTYFDASIRLDNRMLVPLYLFFLLGTFTVLGKAKLPIAPAAVVLLAIMLVYASRTKGLITSTRSQGRGFASKAWQSSPTIELLKSSIPSGAVYSNEAQALYVLLGISAYPAPERTDPVKGVQRAEYESQLTEMRSRLVAPGSALVLFHPDQLREGMPTLAELTSSLFLADRTPDGAIYVDPSSTSQP